MFIFPPFNFHILYIHAFSFGSIRAEQRNHFMYDQLVEPFHIMCKELQTNMYIAKTINTQFKIIILC